ncbi:hypothetical protein [Thermotalea metallivorans]|uniref:Uncharacterized protein n=1 Tax=Thermotalea metallivorans TaxID=520762 RepID=A0A140L270_9FIRM|nr:hypothetical protein [Thermotalea metallivorans]KXG74645.1 hypothetical protein AN619_22320 [Thermotalea metallivorans]
MPAIEKVSPPMYLGIVDNPNITQVNIIEKKRNIVRQAKIIDAKGTRIWLIYMNDLEGSYFKIIGLSKDGKELIIRDDNILPWHVEQKPFKGYN